MHGVFGMERRLFAGCLMVLAAALGFSNSNAVAAARPDFARPAAQPSSSDRVTGLYLTTQYPALTVRAGETATIDLLIHNYRLPPQQLNLSVPQIAAGWKATILGG